MGDISIYKMDFPSYGVTAIGYDCLHILPTLIDTSIIGLFKSAQSFR